jgi:transcriptional regulator of arginine metabolism
MMNTPGFLSINFSGNMGVIKTRPGYASSIAYNIDNTDIPEILGTIAGDDTIFIALREGVRREEVIASLKPVIPNIQ